MSEKRYNKFAQGIHIVKSQNSSFNSDFSGLPRRLPDEAGTIYATDKALKYCVRKYLHDKGETIFVWRRYDKDSKPLNINENYKEVFGKEIPKKPSEAIKNLSKAIDVRLFGATYAGEVNVSLTGTTQLTYGVNKIKEDLFFNNEILSPYQDIKKSEAKQQTLGNETKTLEAHYIYDFVINPNNLIDDMENIKAGQFLSEEDVTQFKEAMCKGVSYVTSASKIGSESELFVFVEMKSKVKDGKIQSHILPLMKNLVEIDRKNDRTVIDLSKVSKALTKSYKKYVDNIELYYDENITDVVGLDGLNVTKKNIVTFERIK